MPAVPVRRRCIRGGMTLMQRRANYSVSGLNQTRDVGQYAANPLGLFRYAWKCLGVDRGLVPGGLSHWQPGGGSHRTGIGLVSGHSGWFLEQRRVVLRSAKRHNSPPAPLRLPRLPCWFPTA